MIERETDIVRLIRGESGGRWTASDDTGGERSMPVQFSK